MPKQIQLILNISELGAGTRGASLGPQAIAVAARGLKSDFFHKYPPTFIPLVNNFLDIPTRFQFAKNIDGIINVYEALREEIPSTIQNGKTPFILAGDHGSAGGTIAGLKLAYPDKRLGVIWIDAHGDLHTPFTTPSGNVHGMPLATALGVDNLECQRNQPDEETIACWNSLKSGAILPEDLIFVGVRDTEPEEDHLMESLKIRNITVAEYREKGINDVMDIINERLQACDLIYVSFDVDSMDPEFTSLGTGTPVPGGLHPEEALLLLSKCVKHPKFAAFELVEVNPCLDDKKNRMAEVAFGIIEKLAQDIH